MSTKRERARIRAELLADPGTPAKVKFDLLREDRLDGRRAPRRTVTAADSAVLESELRAWVADVVIPRFGRPGASADELWERWSPVDVVLDGKVWLDSYTGEPFMSPSPARPLLNDVRDVVWQKTGPFQIWGFGVHHPDLVDGSLALGGLPVGGGLVLPGSHPDSCRFGTDAQR